MNDANITTLREGLSGELFHGGIGLLILIAIQVMNIYKPRGLTPYGWRKQNENASSRANLETISQ